MQSDNKIHWHIGATQAPLPPLARGLPLVGNALAMGQEPTRFVVEMYHTYGPIFRIRLFSREIMVLAGKAANRFATKHDEEVFTNAIDILLQSTDVQGDPFTEAHLLMEAMGPYLARQDTVAGSLTFICYTIHKQPDVRERIVPEAIEGFAEGMPTLGKLRRFETLHKTVIETMRRYPVAPFMPRHAARTFEFGGYRVEAGSEVYSATAVTHFLPEHYPEPWTFDIDRERGPTGTFVPYGVGNYACLGAGIADVQLLVSMAALLRRGRFELDPPGYQAQVKTMPLPNPGPFRLRLVEKFD